MKFRPSHIIIAALFALCACKGGNSASQPSSAAPTEQTTATAAAPSPVDAATAANIEGVVKFSGPKPKEQKIMMTADATCKASHSTDVMSQDVVVNPNNTLQYVYVYVKSGLGSMKFPVPTTPVVFNQQGCMYSPHVVAVQVGQPFVIHNDDSVLHNVNVRPVKNAGFNIGQPIKGMSTTKTFTTPEVMIPVKCDVHPWMHGWIGVQDNPYASVTDNTGAFSLKNLPPGTYEIEAWQEKYGTTSQTVTVGAKETKQIEFTFKGA